MPELSPAIIVEGGSNPLTVDFLRFQLVEGSAVASETEQESASGRCTEVLKDALKLLVKFTPEEQLAVGKLAFMETPLIGYKTPEGHIGQVVLRGVATLLEKEPAAFDLSDAMVQLAGRTDESRPLLPLYTLKTDNIIKLTSQSAKAPGGHRDVNYLQNMLPKIDKAAFSKK